MIILAGGKQSGHAFCLFAQGRGSGEGDCGIHCCFVLRDVADHGSMLSDRFHILHARHDGQLLDTRMGQQGGGKAGHGQTEYKMFHKQGAFLEHAKIIEHMARAKRRISSRRSTAQQINGIRAIKKRALDINAVAMCLCLIGQNF